MRTTIDLTHESPTFPELLALARKGEVILRDTDGTEFLLREFDDFDREIERARENKELMALLERRSQEPTAYTLDEVRAQLGLD